MAGKHFGGIYFGQHFPVRFDELRSQFNKKKTAERDLGGAIRNPMLSSLRKKLKFGPKLHEFKRYFGFILEKL